jgi:hypothetical protein
MIKNLGLGQAYVFNKDRPGHIPLTLIKRANLNTK